MKEIKKDIFCYLMQIFCLVLFEIRAGCRKKGAICLQLAGALPGIERLTLGKNPQKITVAFGDGKVGVRFLDRCRRIKKNSAVGFAEHGEVVIRITRRINFKLKFAEAFDGFAFAVANPEPVPGNKSF